MRLIGTERNLTLLYEATSLKEIKVERLIKILSIINYYDAFIERRKW